MSIPAVVTLGFGNGTFSPGVAFVPTLGFSIAESGTTPFAGIACFHSETLTTAILATESLTQAGATSESLTTARFTNETITGC